MCSAPPRNSRAEDYGSQANPAGHCGSPHSRCTLAGPQTNRRGKAMALTTGVYLIDTSAPSSEFATASVAQQRPKRREEFVTARSCASKTAPAAVIATGR